MSITQIAAPYPIFTDVDGTPLDDGYLYIGEANKNPETNPIQVYWDAALTQPAPQPIRTNNGYPWRMGTPAMLYCATSSFSVTVKNKKSVLVIYAPIGFGAQPNDSGSVTFAQDGVYPQGSVGLALQAVVNIKNAPYNAVGGTTDDSDAIQAAVDALPSTGGKIVFPTGTYTFKDIDILDKESVSFDFQDSVLNLAPGAQYAFKMQNTSADFKKGGVWQNATFGTGSASVGLIWVDGGAWTSQTFSRINNSGASAPADIYYSNNTSPLRNPSNFTFSQCFDRSFGCKYWFHYDAAATTTNFDNFTMRNILFYGNQDGCAVIHFDGAAALYSSFENIYGGMYANNARLVKMTGSIAASRNTWKNFLMEGTGNNRICMDGYYNDSSISTVVNYINESLYTGNQAYSAKTTASKLEHLLLQDATTGSYSTNTALTLLAGSSANEIFKTGVISDLGSKTTVYRGKGDYLVSQTFQQTYTSNSATAILSFNFGDFEVNDVIKIFIAGTASGLYKDLELLEASVRSLFNMPGGLLTEDWSIELTYQVISVAGTKSLSPHLRVFKGTTCVINEFKTPVSFFPATFQLILSVTSPNWTGSSIVLRTAYAAPLYNQN